jgi:hypothetical protein
VAALASLDKKKLCIMVWHYHDDGVAGPDAAGTLDHVAERLERDFSSSQLEDNLTSSPLSK